MKSIYDELDYKWYGKPMREDTNDLGIWSDYKKEIEAVNRYKLFIEKIKKNKKEYEVLSNNRIQKQ